VQTNKDILSEKLSLEDLFDQNKLTAIGLFIGIPGVVSGVMGMNCSIPFQAGADPDLSAFVWIMGISCGLALVLLIYTMVGGYSNSRYDWAGFESEPENNKSRKSFSKLKVNLDRIPSLYTDSKGAIFSKNKPGPLGGKQSAGKTEDDRKDIVEKVKKKRSKKSD